DTDPALGNTIIQKNLLRIRGEFLYKMVESKQPVSVRNLRRPKGHISSVATNMVHLKNPWVTAWWSAAFPGFGHIILGSYVKGFLLVVWELLINVKAKLNLCILYSFGGQFDLARQVVDTRWLLLYAPVYIFAIWDAYRRTVDLNKMSILADREDSTVLPSTINTIEINILDKKHPWLAMVWSAIIPGVGHLYTHRVPTSFFVLIWWISVSYFSNILPAIHLSFTGQFAMAKSVVDMQWLLFLPSMYTFAIYDSYVNCVEYNKLTENEQARFLKDNYQSPDALMPV
ncbi:MAG: hypothetical protein ABRQ26_16630, partial [Syntrophomonadaceae bacterium]